MLRERNLLVVVRKVGRKQSRDEKNHWKKMIERIILIKSSINDTINERKGGQGYTKKRETGSRKTSQE